MISMSRFHLCISTGSGHWIDCLKFLLFRKTFSSLIVAWVRIRRCECLFIFKEVHWFQFWWCNKWAIDQNWRFRTNQNRVELNTESSESQALFFVGEDSLLWSFTTHGGAIATITWSLSSINVSFTEQIFRWTSKSSHLNFTVVIVLVTIRLIQSNLTWCQFAIADFRFLIPV